MRVSPAIVVFFMVPMLVVGAVPAAGEGAGELWRTDGVVVDDIRITVTVAPNGDAAWVVEHRSRLDTDDRRDAFEALVRDLDEDPADYVDPFATNMAETAAVAAAVTGREMAIVDVTIAAETVYLPQEYGLVVYGFTWTGFAAVDAGEIRVGDAIGGLFLDGDTTMRVNWPAEYGLEEVRPTPDEEHASAVIWHGPVDFDPSEPRLVVTEPSSGIMGDGRVFGPLVGVSFMAGVLGVYVALRRVRGVRVTPRITGVLARAGSRAGSESAMLLSNEEQVLELLASNGGRVKQQEIAGRLGWSETKTSQVVREMHDAGGVYRFRLGRENVVSVPEHDPRK